MEIDVCIDLVCPWCYIGKRRLQRALGLRPALQVQLIWHPFMLNPNMAETGVDRKGYLLNKFGTESRVRRLLGALEVTGQSEEIDFNFDDIEHSPNTRDAHRVVRYARSFGQAEPVVEALFRAYFVEGQNIGCRNVLCTIGSTLGLVHDDLQTYLNSDEDVAWVNEQNESAHRLGVNGVPCYVINNEMALQGAQPAEVLARLLDAASA